jgi:hypothetical protein
MKSLPGATSRTEVCTKLAPIAHFPRFREPYSLTNSFALHKVRSIASQLLKLSSKGATMKNVYEVLRQKELELARLEKEVEALRVAAPLLSDDKDVGSETTTAKPTLTTATPAPQQPIRIPQPQVAATQPTARAAGWEDNAKRWP